MTRGVRSTLCRAAAFGLLKVDPSRATEEKVRGALEAMDDVRVSEVTSTYGPSGGARGVASSPWCRRRRAT